MAEPLHLLPERDELSLDLEVAGVCLLDVDVFGAQFANLGRELVPQIQDLMVGRSLEMVHCTLHVQLM